MKASDAVAGGSVREARSAAGTDEEEAGSCGGLSAALRYTILALTCVLAFGIRLFAVTRWESVIHEFDPWFNFRSTKYLVDEGWASFLNWQDDRSWYPLGRLVGGTIYPGLMATAAGLQWLLAGLHIPINVRNMCVFLAPVFAGATAVATYLLTSEVTRRRSTGLLAAALVAIVPSYISRSVGGSYDNEGVAIFALVFTFYLWVKAVSSGRLAWAAAAALSYFYMVAAWGGYVFIINIIPIHVIILVAAGRYSGRLYVAYSTFYVLGSLLALQVPFVGFNVVRQAESAASHGVFLLVQVAAVYSYLAAKLGTAAIRNAAAGAAAVVVAGAAASLIGLQVSGRMEWSGRSLTLLDPTYAKKYIPIIASVSEHQPTSWTSFLFDLHLAVPFAPVGLYFLFNNPDSGGSGGSGGISDGRIFLILYGTISWYFAGVMVRLMLTLAPAACMLAAVGISGLLHTFLGHLKRGRAVTGVPWVLSAAIAAGTFGLLALYTFHASFVSSEAYSSPSIVLASKRADGSRVIFDDYREAYYWLRMNTKDDAKVLSWWDYGYQMTGMANRTVLVDNGTWNYTHIATVGRALASTEEEAYPILASLDVDYVLVIFGGVAGYASDDINKFLWPVRIGASVFPHIKEADYFVEGQYRLDKGGSPTMLNSMMYKMCYYRFGEMQTQFGRGPGWDLARSVDIGTRRIQLTHLEEAFTSEHWIVRIYKVKKPVNTEGELYSDSDGSGDRFGRRPEALVAMGRSAAPTRRNATADAGAPQPAAAQAAKAGGAGAGAVRYIGCYKLETSFGEDRVYGGGAAGASVALSRAHAVATRKRFFATARVGADGHSFAFNMPSGMPEATGGGCDRPCADDASQRCGCADAACQEPRDPGQDHVRRWAVYQVVDDAGADVAAAAGATAKSRKR